MKLTQETDRVDKNTSYREAMKQVADPNLQAFSVDNVTREGKYSVAVANYKAILERYGSEGVKSEGNRTKRERERETEREESRTGAGM